MGRRSVLLVVLAAAAVVLLAAPAAYAAISVMSIAPNHGASGETIACTVSGRFQHPTDGQFTLLPEFQLVKGATTIRGTTTGMQESTGAEAYVTFTLPPKTQVGSYDLKASQAWGFRPVLDTATLEGAFSVDPPPTPPPAISSIEPAQVWAGYVKNNVVLVVHGTGFLDGARVTFGGMPKIATTFVSATELSLPLVSADIAVPKTIAVGVDNPMGGASSASTLPLAVVPETTTPVVSIGGAGAGWWFNAPVTLTFQAVDSQSGVQRIEYMAPPGMTDWVVGTSYTVPVTKQGSVTVHAQALDWCNNAGTATVKVGIDTTPPQAQILSDPVTVKKYADATIEYRVKEPQYLSPSATVVFRVRTLNGTIRKTITIDAAPMNKITELKLTCPWNPGTYSLDMSATDLAGNIQLKRAKLKVKVEP